MRFLPVVVLVGGLGLATACGGGAEKKDDTKTTAPAAKCACPGGKCTCPECGKGDMAHCSCGAAKK